MKFIYLVWRNLLRKKLRTFLTVSSIIVAFVLFGLLSGLKTALGAGVSVAAENRMMVRHRVSFINPLPYSYMPRIERIPGVKAVSHQSWFGGYYQEQRNQVGSFPVEPERFFELNPEILLPEAQKEAWKRTRTGAIIGRKLAARFNWNVGDRVTLMSLWPGKNGNAWEFDIVGIYDGAKKQTDTTGFFLRYDYFDENKIYQKGTVGWFQVTVNDPKKIVDVAAAIDEEFANSQAETKTESEAAMVQGFVQQIGDIGTIVAGILSAVFFTIMLVAGNTMAQSVRERTQEIGVLKAMGFTNRLVLGVVLGESFAIALLGGLAGLAAGVLVVSGLAHVPQLQTYFPVLLVPGRDLLLGLACALALGFVAGILPAVQAMRLRLADAIRSEG